MSGAVADNLIVGTMVECLKLGVWYPGAIISKATSMYYDSKPQYNILLDNGFSDLSVPLDRIRLIKHDIIIPVNCGWDTFLLS